MVVSVSWWRLVLVLLPDGDGVDAAGTGIDDDSAFVVT